MVTYEKLIFASTKNNIEPRICFGVIITQVAHSLYMIIISEHNFFLAEYEEI